VTRSFRIPLAILVVCCLAGLPLAADKKPKSDDDGMVLEVSTKKKKNKDDDMTQTLPPPKEPPTAVVADTDRLMFQVSPLSAKGLLSQQTRDAMKALLRSNHGGAIVKLRAFVAGSGDMRRIQDIAGEVFTAAHLNLPALSVVQAGALPLEGAQVVIESIATEKRAINENGVAFVSGQAGNSVSEAIEQMKKTLATAQMDGSDVRRVTCFVSSLEANQNARALIDAAFPAAAFNYVQMQRGPVTPAAECEGVARLREAPSRPVTYFSVPGAAAGGAYSQMVLVHAPKVVFTSTQLGFGSQESDVRLAFDRLQKALASLNANLGKLAMSHVYLTSMAIAEKVRAVRKTFYDGMNPPASTLLPFEALPSLDALFGVDVVAVPEPGV
jgi:enamine deaminase RidA (YjgF/YER057c/UK114 family)